MAVGYKITQYEYKIITQEELKQQLNNPLDFSWPMYQHDAAHTGFSEGLFPDNFSQIWFKSYEEDFNIKMASLFTSPVTSNGKLYIAGDLLDSEQQQWSNIILALNQSNGSLIWKKEILSNSNALFGFQSFHSPAVYDGKIIAVLGCFFTFMSKSKIVALDENTGDILWEKTFFGSSYYQSVTVDDGKVFVCGVMTFCPISWLYVFDANNGNLIWRKTIFGYIETTPVVYENKVFVASGRISGWVPINNIFQLFSGKSRVYAFDVDDGQEIWMKKVKGHLIMSSPTAANGKLFVPSNIKILNSWYCRICALDIETSEEIWHHDMKQKKLGGWPTSISTPSVAYGKVFVIDSDGILRAWDQNSGDLIFLKEITPNDPYSGADNFAPPVIIDGKIMVGANSEGAPFNKIFILDAGSGELLFNFKFNGESYAPFIVSNELLFVNDGFNGGIYAFG
jgi:outer membrane protein assembly factor BamB